MLKKIRATILFERERILNQDDFRKTKLIWNVTFTTSLFCIFYISVSLAISFMAGAISQGITLLLYLILLNLFRIKSLSNNFLAFLYLLIAFQTVVILPFYSGGIQAHSVILPWLAMVPVISSLLSTFKQSLIWFFIILGAITAYAFIPDDLVSITYDQRYDKVFTIAVYSGLTLIVFGVTQNFRMSSLRAIKNLELANIEINRHKELLESTCNQLDNSNKEIIDSIYYAKGVQRSVLPTKKSRQNIIKESFCFQKPKNRLNGDFYWLEERKGIIYLAVIDCQEHGVAGAFKSITIHNVLHEILNRGEKDIKQILVELNNRLNQVYPSEEIRRQKTFHISLVKWNKKLKTLNISSTKNSILLGEAGQLKEIKFNDTPMGFLKKQKQNSTIYHTETINAETGLMLYLYTDGFSNQLGGLENTPYTNERLYTALNNISHLGMTEQSHNLYCRLNDWKKSNELTDDILVMGIKIQ